MPNYLIKKSITWFINFKNMIALHLIEFTTNVNLKLHKKNYYTNCVL